MSRDLPWRVWVLGPAGSGKTTLARQLSTQLRVPHVQLDDTFWGPGWSRTPEDEFVLRVAEVAASTAWVVDGQYEAAHPLLGRRAQAAVWLDLPLPATLTRLARRALADFRTGRELCNGNQQTVRGAVALMTWAARVNGPVRRRNSRLREKHPALRITRFTSAPNDAEVMEAMRGFADVVPDPKREDHVHG